MWQLYIYPSCFTAGGTSLWHPDQRRRMCKNVCFDPNFHSFYPSTNISDYARNSAQLRTCWQLNANMGVLLKATQNLPMSPYWTPRAADSDEKVTSLQVLRQQCSALELKLPKGNISVQIWATMHSDTVLPSSIVKETHLLQKWLKILLNIDHEKV